LERPLEYSSNFDNEIYNNTIADSETGIMINPDVSKNSIHNNTIINSESAGIFVSNFTKTNNIIYDNSFYNNQYAIHTKSLTNTTPKEFVNLVSIWCKNKIDNSSVKGIQYLAHNNEITGSETESTHTTTQIISAWVKNNVCWRSNELISQEDFDLGINYLSNKEIIQVKSNQPK
jgi:hypothetical protein